MHSTGKLTIDTPEQIMLELPLAGIGSRFLAFAFDTLLQIVLGVVVFLCLLFGGLMLPAGSVRLLAWVPAYVVAPLLILLGFCVYWGYFALFEIFWKGQTPGKRQAGIRVIKDTGRPLNVFEAIARNLMRAVDGLPGMYGVGLVTMMLNQQNRRLGDFVAGTVVVHDRAMHEVRPDWDLSGSAHDAVQPAVTGVSADELVLIETYLQRRFELEPEVRAAHAHNIVGLLAAKTGLQPEPGQPVDDFLEAVARQVRDTARFR